MPQPAVGGQAKDDAGCSFLAKTVVAAAAAFAVTRPGRAARGSTTKFFTIGSRHGRSWYLPPEGAPFFSLGLNHIDPSPLRYLESGDVWWRKYDNRMERWIKEAVRPGNEWKGPVFDPAKLQTEAGRAEFHRIATRYYQVTRDAVRRYDRNHLILGDRYEVNAPLPDEVLLAAKPFVDVFSFQHFGSPERIGADLARFAALTGKPVLLADSSGNLKLPDGTIRNDPVKYRRTLAALREVPACVGFHLCGAYLRNRTRHRGLRGPDESPDTVALEGITAANREMAEWVRQQVRV